MDTFPLLKGQQYQLSERKKSSQYRQPKSTAQYLLTNSESSPVPQKPAAEIKQIKYSNNLFRFPLPSKSQSARKKIVSSYSDGKLLKNRLLSQRSSEQALNSGTSFNPLQSDKKSIGLYELKYSFKAADAHSIREKKGFQDLGLKIRMQGVDKVYRSGRNALAYFDHTVPQSISIQSKSFKGV